MQLIKQQLFSSTSFAGKYINKEKTILSFYDYSIDMEQERAAELAGLTYQRDQLADAMLSFQKKMFPCEKAERQIELLRSGDTLTVVGGQQTGLFTGPMYTIHKIISILSEAERLNKKLQQPVIPVFWMAGEDHDIDEINHTYVFRGTEQKKVKIAEKNQVKTPASERIIDSEAAKGAVLEALQHLQETKETKRLKQALLEDIDETMTYTSWCAKILYRIFKGSGLVIMDAHDPMIREIEKPYFEKMVADNELIRKAFTEQAILFKENGYGEPVSIEEDNAHLFFHENHQRFLLQADEKGWKEKGKDHYWRAAEFEGKVKSGDIDLSNNVVTRPVMQDLLMPVHTFIAGAGELAYWGVLKQVFHLFGHRMPIVRPRHSITFISKKSAKTMQQYQLDLSAVLQNGTKTAREKRIEEAKNINEKELFIEAGGKMQESLDLISTALPENEMFLMLHESYKKKAASILADYEKSIEAITEEIEKVHLRRLNALELEIFPGGQKQERYFSVISYLNSEGNDVVPRLLEKVKALEDGTPRHYISYL